MRNREGEDEEAPEEDTARDWLHSAQMSEYKFTVCEHVPSPIIILTSDRKNTRARSGAPKAGFKVK